MAKRVGQMTPMCDPKTTTVAQSLIYRVRKIDCIFAARKKIAGRYFRGKIFSSEKYIRQNIFSRKYLKLTFREIFLPLK